jgi:dipeptidyl aminopeptidase/acylaminoacyl peptidase
LTSAGSVPVTLGAATLDGQYAAEYQVLANDCMGRTLARGETCAVTLRATPAGKGPRAADLRVVADTPRGERVVALAVTGATVPSAPYPLEVYRVVGSTRLWWGEVPPSGDGGAPVTGYRVSRSTAGGPWVELATVPPGEQPEFLSYEDATTTPGVTYAYAVSAVNAVGDSAKRTAAAKVAPRSEVLHTRGLDADMWGVYAQNERAATPGVTNARFDRFVDGTDHVAPAVSPDGRSIVYVAPTEAGYGLWRREFAGGEPVLLTTMAGDETQPDWSPDGLTIAFTSMPASGTNSVWTVPAAGGTPVKRTSAAQDPSWQADSETLVVVDLGATLRLLRVTKSGARTAITGTFNGIEPAVSPDGQWLAFTRWYGEQWQLAILPLAGATTPRYMSSNVDHRGPAWRRDARFVYSTSADDEGRSYVGGFAWNPATSGGFGASAGFSDSGRDHGAVQRVLGLHLTSAPHVTGPSARVEFAITVPLAGETTTCSLDGAAPVACVSPWTRSGLRSGQHTLVIRSTVAGQQDTLATHTWVADATPPVVTLTSPASAVTLGPSVTVGYRATGAVSYDVRYRTAPASGGYTAYAAPAAWQKTTATSVSLPAKAGTEVCFSVRARDSWGNTSAWTADRCSAVAYDDRALTASAGWRRATSAAAYLGTLTSSTTRGAALTKAGVTASRVYVVGARCPTCGAVDVYVGSTLLGRASLAGVAADRVVLALPKRSAPVAGTLRLVTVSTAPVRIDGVAVLRV